MAEVIDIKKELGKEDINIAEVNIVFLDISSSCTGYSVAKVDFTNKKANFIKAGALWLNPDWSHQEKYAYMYNVVVNYFWIVDSMDFMVVEQYSVNPRKMSGINVVSEMQGSIKAAAWENGVKVVSFLPQSWRSELGLKKIKTSKGETDWKTPTKDFLKNLVTIPDEVVSNITGNSRAIPSDVFDSLGLGMGWLYRMGIKNITFNNIEFNSHIGYTSK